MSVAVEARTNLFANVVDDDRISALDMRQLEMLSRMLAPLSATPVGTVTDGHVRVHVMREHNGFITCDNMPRDFYGLAYWDYWSDVVSFACEHNPQLDAEVAWMESPDGELLEDEWDDE